MSEFEEPIRWQQSERQGPITPSYAVKSIAQALRDVVEVLQSGPPIGRTRAEIMEDEELNATHSPTVY